MDNEKKYKTEEVHTCSYCSQFSFVEVEDVKEHINICLNNYDDNKSCLTCEHFRIRLEPPFRQNPYLSKRITNELGYVNIGTCEILETDLSEEEIVKLNNECWEKYETDDLEEYIIKSDQYLDYEKTMNAIADEEREITEIIDKLKSFGTQEELDAYVIAELAKTDSENIQ